MITLTVMLSETLRYLRRIEQMQGFFTSLFSAQCVMSLHDTPKDENRVEISRSSDGLRNIAVFFRREMEGWINFSSAFKISTWENYLKPRVAQTAALGVFNFFDRPQPPKCGAQIRRPTLPAPKEEKTSQMSHLSPSVPPPLLC